MTTFDLTYRPIFTLETERLGLLQVGQITTTVLKKLSDAFKNRSDAPPDRFVRYFVSTVAFRPNEAGRSDVINEKGKINPAEADLLTPAEIGEFARKFAELDDQLLSETKIRRGKGQAEHPTLVMKKEKIDIPKLDNETDEEYLRRLLIRLIEAHAKIYKPIEDQLNRLFSSPLVDQMTTNAKLAQDLISRSTQLKSYSKPFHDFEVPHIPKITPIGDYFKQLTERLDRLLRNQSATEPILTTSADLLANMNTLSAAIAADSKKSFRENKWFSIVIILLTGATLLGSIVFSSIALVSSTKNQRNSEKQVAVLIQEVQTLNKNMDELRGIRNDNIKTHKLLERIAANEGVKIKGEKNE